MKARQNVMLAYLPECDLRPTLNQNRCLLTALIWPYDMGHTYISVSTSVL